VTTINERFSNNITTNHSTSEDSDADRFFKLFLVLQLQGSANWLTLGHALLPLQFPNEVVIEFVRPFSFKGLVLIQDTENRVRLIWKIDVSLSIYLPTTVKPGTEVKVCKGYGLISYHERPFFAKHLTKRLPESLC
jgi:hypothetical protein